MLKLLSSVSRAIFEQLYAVYNLSDKTCHWQLFLHTMANEESGKRRHLDAKHP